MSHDPSDPTASTSTDIRNECGARRVRKATPAHRMVHGHRPAASEQVPATLVPESGWHFLHLFYRIDRGRSGQLSSDDRQRGLEDLLRVLRVKTAGAPEQLQCFAVPGHKADFGIVMAGPDLRAIHDIQMAIQASSLGPARLQPRTRSTRSPKSPSTSPTPKTTPRSSATAKGSTPRATSTRPRSTPMPSGSGR